MNNFWLCVAIILVCFWTFFCGYSMREKTLTQQLCSKQQYDFCEVIEHKPEYKLKELKQDD